MLMWLQSYKHSRPTNNNTLVAVTRTGQVASPSWDTGLPQPDTTNNNTLVAVTRTGQVASPSWDTGLPQPDTTNNNTLVAVTRTGQVASPSWDTGLPQPDTTNGDESYNIIITAAYTTRSKSHCLVLPPGKFNDTI